MVERILFAPGGASEAKQDDILAALAAALVELQGKFEAGQEVALDAATLAALESIQAQVAGTVALDAPTLAALENVTATVANFPVDYPDAGALAALAAILAALGGTLTVDDGHPDPQTDALTNMQLRAAPVEVSGVVTVQEPVTVDGVQTDALTEAQLRSSDVLVADDYDLELVTPDQTGAGAVLTFDLGQSAPLVTVDVDPVSPSDTDTYICRVRLDGTSPTASSGHRCRSGQTTYLPFPSPTGVVKVYAPVGVTVSVQGGGRT